MDSGVRWSVTVAVFILTACSGVMSDNCTQDGLFGAGCKYRCHCIDNTTCNTDYGNCTDGGCKAGYTGAACQYADLAFGQETHGNAEKFEYGNTSLAVDGNDETCFVSPPRFNSSWSVQLQAPSWIQTISMLVVKTSADPKDLEVTAHASDFFPGRKYGYDFKCNYVTAKPSRIMPGDLRYYYQLPRSVRASRVQIRSLGNETSLSLCDVNVYGECQVKDDLPWLCDSECRCRDSSELCDRLWGTCPDSGCRLGWTGDQCRTACSPGSHGYNCSQKCSSHCLGELCDATSGECSSGCVPGQTGWYCEATESNATLITYIIIGVCLCLLLSLAVASLVAKFRKTGEQPSVRSRNKKEDLELQPQVVAAVPDVNGDCFVIDDSDDAISGDNAIRCCTFCPNRRGSMDLPEH